jgi:Domain of unknown function (DUF6259)
MPSSEKTTSARKPTNHAPGSPAAECRQQGKLSPEPVILEDQWIKVSFDRGTGALIELVNKTTGWSVIGRPEMGQSFRAFLSQPHSLYNVAMGNQSPLTRVELRDGGRVAEFVWTELNTGIHHLAIEFSGIVELVGGQLEFKGEIRNQSDYRLNTISWPFLGHLTLPKGATALVRENLDYGTLRQTPLLPRMKNEKGYFGTNFPIQLEGKGSHAGAGTSGIHLLQRFVLINAGTQGLYLGVHEDQVGEMVCFINELRPGWLESIFGTVPAASTLGFPVGLTLEAMHYPFVNPQENRTLARIVMSPYQGDWAEGVAALKRWREQVFQPVRNPAWLDEVHAWQQLQIGSSEDDLRTRFVDLPARAASLPENQVTALQLVGWNDGGQDRGNPSHDPDPRLGSWDDLRQAIAEIEASGVRVVLFNKFVWADATRPDFPEMASSMAKDPNGLTYFHPGWEYQTPVQLMSINTRRLAVACLHDPLWADRCLREFRKSIELGASGILYDEAFHHWSATHCFASNHGHRVPATLWSADYDFGLKLRGTVENGVGSDNFLLAAEAPYDLQQQHYGLSYFRIGPDHIPVERYLDPYYPIMIAVIGFDDREMLNRALLFRYIISYEPFNFKGDLTDYPATLEYGRKVDQLRRRYSDYLWHAAYRHHRGAQVCGGNGTPVPFGVFKNEKTAKRAVVLLNDSLDTELSVEVVLDPPADSLQFVSPESQEPTSTNGKDLRVAPRSALVVLER